MQSIHLQRIQSYKEKDQRPFFISENPPFIIVLEYGYPDIYLTKLFDKELKEIDDEIEKLYKYI